MMLSKKISSWSLSKKITIGSFLMALIVTLSLLSTMNSIKQSTLEEVSVQRGLISQGVRGQLTQIHESEPVYKTLVLGALSELETTIKKKSSIQLNTSKSIEIIPGTSVPSLEVDGVELSKNFEATDKVSLDLGVTATIFVKSGQDFIRVATNIKQDNGSRAIGTKLSINGPAYKALINGESYNGLTQILDKPYYTTYKPIISTDNQIIGALYAGYLLKSFISAVEFVDHSVIFKNGFFMLYQNQGEKIIKISTQLQKESSEEQFYEWLKNKGTDNLETDNWIYFKSTETDGFIVVSKLKIKKIFIVQ